MKLKGILTIARPNFLFLAVILGILGTSIAWYEHQEFGGLSISGMLSGHFRVNHRPRLRKYFNDYFDSRSKLDTKTQRTPFSRRQRRYPVGTDYGKTGRCGQALPA